MDVFPYGHFFFHIRFHCDGVTVKAVFERGGCAEEVLNALFNVYAAEEEDVFGHTHVPLCEYYGDALLINPGSPSRPRGGSKPCFAVLTLQKGATPEVEFFQS